MSDRNLRKVFLVVAGGNPAAENHFEETIQRKSKLEEVRKALPSQEIENLERIYHGSNFIVWGAAGTDAGRGWRLPTYRYWLTCLERHCAQLYVCESSFSCCPGIAHGFSPRRRGYLFFVLTDFFLVYCDKLRVIIS